MVTTGCTSWLHVVVVWASLCKDMRCEQLGDTATWNGMKPSDSWFYSKSLWVAVCLGVGTLIIATRWTKRHRGDKQDKGFRYLDGERKATHPQHPFQFVPPHSTNGVFSTVWETREKELESVWQSRKERTEVTEDISVNYGQCTIEEGVRSLTPPHDESLESQFSMTDPLPESSEMENSRKNLNFECVTVSGPLCGLGEDGGGNYGGSIAGYSCGGGGGGGGSGGGGGGRGSGESGSGSSSSGSGGGSSGGGGVRGGGAAGGSGGGGDDGRDRRPRGPTGGTSGGGGGSEEVRGQGGRKHGATTPRATGSGNKKMKGSIPASGGASPAKVLTARETSLRAVKFLLDTKVALWEGPGSPLSPGPGCITVATYDLPVTKEEMKLKFHPLFTKCASRELDMLQYCISCFVRASHAPQAGWNPEVWSALSHCTQEVTVSNALQQLIDGSSRQNEDDLWSTMYGKGKSQGILSVFLERLSGWSSDGVQVPGEMLKDMVTAARETPVGRNVILQLVETAGAQVKTVKKPDELMAKAGKVFDGLEVLFAQLVVAEVMSEMLLKEVEDGVRGTGDYFERSSALSAFLSVTTVLDRLTPFHLRDEKYSCFTGLRNFPNFSQVDAINCHTHIQDGLHRCQRTVHSGLLKMLKSPKRSNTIAWMAAVVTLNEQRAGPRFKKNRGTMQGACSDGFMINFCAVMLELCKPFFSSDPSGQKLGLISAQYATSPSCRLNLHNEPCLAQGVVSTEQRLPKNYKQFLPPDNNFKFVTECFYITQRALHIGLLPAVETFSSTASDLGKQIQAEIGGEGEKKILKDLHALYLLGWTCCLLDPQLAQYCSEFYITQAVWITRQVESCREEGVSEEEVHERQRKLLAGIPEYCVKDMASWFRFVVLARPALLQGLQVTPCVDCCVGLLERPDLLPSPLAQGRIVSVLLAFVNSDKRGGQRERLLGAESWSGILGELSVMVQASPTVQDHLGPALLHTYAAVKVVEGLDVDKENFDKYATRYEIAQLLHRLWERTGCRESILRECGSKKFQSFLSAIFDTLLYQLNDALSRLINVRKYEVAKDMGQWSSLSTQQRREKEAFLAGEQRASRGFMTQANLQLELLQTMVEVEPVAQCLCVPPLAKRTAAAMLGFLDTLCGSRASELKVKDMEKYAFDPRRLLVQITSILLRVWQQDKGNRSQEAFTVSMATHPDFSEAVMGKCSSVLQKQQLLDPEMMANFTHFIQQVHQIQQVAASPRSPLVTRADSSTSHAADWQQAVEAIQLDEEGLREAYIAAVEESKYDSAELEVVHTLAEKAQQTLDPRSPKVKAILRDMKQLQEALPIHPNSAILVRQDEDRMDLVRVLITGPVDTPYSRGCFVFDVYYPSTYPANPPIVFMITTGGGTIRFNPNLYADGKVCLSLLGTWHGGDATEKWDPLRSNLLQVLLSIQGMIFIPDPMFNEPGYEAIRGTGEGNTRSQQYNADIQVHTVRYAMLEQLRNPPTGFEDVIRVHFAIQRDTILKQCSQWLKEAVSPEHERRLRKAVDEFRAMLDQL